MYEWLYGFEGLRMPLGEDTFSVHPEVPIFFSLPIGPDFYNVLVLLWEGRQSSAQWACYLPSLSLCHIL